MLDDLEFDESLWNFINSHKPEGELPSSAAIVKGNQTDEELIQAVRNDYPFCYIWAAKMLGVSEGNETHTEWLEAVGRAALALREKAN